MKSMVLRLTGLSIALLVLAHQTVSAQRTIPLDVATIADVNAAFAAGTLTSERLVQMFLARIDAFDRKGPMLRSVITINPRRSTRRGHSIPSAS